jgi:[acyl-carrier-protein] S-malonyltransferase
MKEITALVFPGQGSQKVGMGKDLNDNFQVAREVFETVDDILKSNLSKIIFEGPAEDLTQTQNTQPALMAVSIALIRVLEKEFGQKVQDISSFVAGHSLGEYSALCASGAISLEDTAKLLQIRGNAMAKCGQKTEGSMAAIIGAEIDLVKEVVELASKDGGICQFANDNSVGQIVISGAKDAINNAIKIAKEKGIKRALPLPVSGAFHSQLMQDAATEMQEALQKIEIKPPSIPLIANVSANITSDPAEIKKLLVEQITGQVRWRETMLLMQDSGIENIIEIGSGKVLAGLVSRTCTEISSKSIQNLEDLQSNFS